MFPSGSVPGGTRPMGHGVLLRASDPGGARSPSALPGALTGIVAISLALREVPLLSFLRGIAALEIAVPAPPEGPRWVPRLSPPQGPLSG